METGHVTRCPFRKRWGKVVAMDTEFVRVLAVNEEDPFQLGRIAAMVTRLAGMWRISRVQCRLGMEAAKETMLV